MLPSYLDQQGMLFKKMQKNITSGINNRTKIHETKLKPSKTKREGFTDTLLNKKYAQVTDEYSQIQSEIQTNNLNILKRLDPRTNSTLGKNITLNKDQAGYVTEQGVFKAYNPTTWENNAGKFGCPPKTTNQNVSVNEDDQINASVPGYTFTTDNFPTLLVGQPMQSGSACGSAGKNVYVDRLVDNPTAKYIGCYLNNDGNNADAMSHVGTLGYDSCLKTAMNSNASYFALSQNGENSNQTNCLISNDLSSVQQYGEPPAFTPVLVWESKTVGTVNKCTVTNTGTLVISAVDGDDTTPLFQSNTPVSQCKNGGNISKLVATFGGNCAEKYAVKTGNATDAVMSTYDSLGKPGSFSFLVNGENIGGNPADGCSKKSWDVSYLCGNASKIDHIDNASGKNVKFNCEAEVAKCQFQFTLTNTGNACLFQVINDSKTNIWCAYKNTSTKALTPNPAFKASLGKFGVNYLKSEQTLFSGEWIGSHDGSLRLIMQTDGNLCLYSYQPVQACAMNSENHMVGTSSSSNVNAVHQVSPGGNKDVLGNLAYIDQDDVLHNYPSSALAYSDKYTILQNTNSEGNDLSTLPNSTLDACKSACTEKDTCAGFAFESNANVCYLKNSKMYPRGNLNVINGITTGVRLPQVKTGNSCSSDVQNISSEKYDHYIQGDELTESNMGRICNPFSSNPITNTEKIKYDKINNRLEKLGTQMMSGTELYGDKTASNQNKFAENQAKMLKSVASYKDAYGASYKKEGMLNMQDVERMKSDSEIIVIHENMQYIYWMLAALGLMTVCIVMAKKQGN
jgi:hypothetical protein